MLDYASLDYVQLDCTQLVCTRMESSRFSDCPTRVSVALCQAYAKLLGNYQALFLQSPVDVLTDLTGAIGEELRLDEMDRSA